ncbi:hypothetical protein J2W42_005474 [Rhizobium tibeticum]|uniref:hypothetical protein n=1 Tax=Rhizobium tibeticum TaxID=501024 RepID=UPI00278937B0|nr:hypothetical protein [Rhizobium tibeticum]MDP9812604.1 hypothetical protein [Rhizobium tibeticum]
MTDVIALCKEDLTMNRVSALSLIAAMTIASFLSLSGAYGQGAAMNWPKDIEQTVTSFSGNKINIIYLNAAAEQNQAQTWVQLATPQQRAGLVAAVKANQALMQKLSAQNVEVENIAGAEVAADGGLTIYVK